jgi:hypothetical protein
VLKITCNEKNLLEKRYIFDIIFNEYLGLNYQLILDSNSNNYLITLPNNNQLLIEDHFWSRIQNDELEYLSEDFLPKKIEYSINQFTIEKDLPVLYGNPEVSIDSGKVHCQNDIFAAVYFFLTRWEEYISTDLDFSHRFKYSNSISYKYNLTFRPIVNEIVEFIWKILEFMEFKVYRKKWVYEPYITHDIDQPVRLINLQCLLSDFYKNLFRYGNIKGAFFNLIIYPLNKITYKYDLANCYDFLMDTSEMIGIKSYFNFQSSAKTKYDWGYDVNSKFIKHILKKIKNRDHFIGFHPSFYSIENPSTWSDEYKKLCKAAEFNIKCGRQHYLRFRVPYTWQMWEENGLEIDSTLGFAQIEGFRCGTCWEYSVYNFLSRKKLKLKEMPLIFMEVSIIKYSSVKSTAEFFNRFDNMVSIVKKYNGKFVFLWHNSTFDRSLFTKEFYSNLIEHLR